MARLEGYEPPTTGLEAGYSKKVFRSINLEISVLRLSQIMLSFRRFLAILAEFSHSFETTALQRLDPIYGT